MKFLIEKSIDNTELSAKASRLGLRFVLIAPVMKNDWSSSLAIAGNTFSIKDTLKSHGARWNSEVKAWNFRDEQNAFRAIESIQEAN